MKNKKKRYLDACITEYSPDYTSNLRSLFNKTEPVEQMFGKDISEFSTREISDFYALSGFSNEYVYSNTNSRLSAYCEWCCKQLLVTDGLNHFREFTMKDFSNYVNQRLEKNKYLSKEEFYKLVDELANPRDQFLLLCLFEIGKSPHFDDIFKMELKDIDQEKGTVALKSGRTVKISKKLINKAIEADECLSYFLVVSQRTRPLVPSEYIFKKAPNANDNSNDASQSNKLVTKILRTMASNYGIYNAINATSIAVSGQIAMITRRAEELGIAKDEYVKTHFDELQAQYYMSPNSATMYLRKYGAYL